jgi:hypothetical protein
MMTLRQLASSPADVPSAVAWVQDRVRPVVVGNARLRDRDEEEVRGYRDALRLIRRRTFTTGC